MGRGIVAIVGSPNVGKSTIFNRMIGERHAIVDDEAGITRDRLYAECSWRGVTFSLVDTGGVEIANAPFQKQIRMQAQIAIDEADVIIFVCDGQVGITVDDEVVAKMLYKVKKPVILAVNKIDEGTHLANASEFYGLGLGHPFPVSGSHGVGIGDLLDEVIKHLDSVSEELNEDQITFSLIGRPNVGKSSLVNAFTNQQLSVVSDVKGTTTDPVKKSMELLPIGPVVIIDTAGLDDKGNLGELRIEKTMQILGKTDIAVLVYKGLENRYGYLLSYDKHLKKFDIFLLIKLFYHQYQH